jgi:hypothetical protein
VALGRCVGFLFKYSAPFQADREQIIKKVCLTSHCIMEQKEYYKKLANLTEGYKFGDLVHMMDRVVFYAVKESECFVSFLETEILSSTIVRSPQIAGHHRSANP